MPYLLSDGTSIVTLAVDCRFVFLVKDNDVSMGCWPIVFASFRLSLSVSVFLSAESCTFPKVFFLSSMAVFSQVYLTFNGQSTGMRVSRSIFEDLKLFERTE